jgi:hypothetical protein
MHIFIKYEKALKFTLKFTLAATCFGLRPSSGKLHLSLAKVTLMLKQSVKLRRYVFCGGVAACCNMLPHSTT